jgi:flagellin
VRDGLSAAGSNDSAISKAAAFNAVSGSDRGHGQGERHHADRRREHGTGAIAGETPPTSFTSITSNWATSPQEPDAVTQGANIAAAFNAVSNQSGVTATFSTTTGAVSLTAADGRNISLIGTWYRGHLGEYRFDHRRRWRH